MTEQRIYHVGCPNMPNKSRFLALVDQLWRRKWLTNNGPLVCSFERVVSEYLHVKGAVAVSNATVGLQLAAKALGLTGEVIVPAFTFIATAHAFKWIGLKPVFCDIDPITWCIDPKEVKKQITPETSAIIGVHLFGQPCDIDALSKIALDNSLHLIFDAAHAFGNSYGSKKIGSFGDLEVFSFHATKVMNSFEGGLITTNSRQLIPRLELGRNFGFEGEDNVVDLGTNAKMSEVHAAMGLASLEAVGNVIEVNRRNYELYSRLLEDIPGIKLRSSGGNYHYVVLEVAKGRDELLSFLKCRGVLARRYFYPGCDACQPYNSPSPCPVSNRASEVVLCLPTGTSIDPEDVRFICDMIRSGV